MRSLGYTFRNAGLLVEALRHPSTGMPNNQRLEFLGDAVLQLIISERLYLEHPDVREGKLTKMRQGLVCEQALADVARRIDLDRNIVLEHGSREAGIARQDGPLSDAMEAVLAAVYLDGGFECVRGVIDRLWPAVDSQVENAKSRLQELLQAKGRPTPVYRLLGEEGPDHDLVFTVEVSLDDGMTAVGKGHSKKLAEQQAAVKMLGQLDGRTAK